jgi:hypothetical protein
VGFEDHVFDVVREVAAEAVRLGAARLETGTHPGGGPYLEVTPTDPAACPMTVWAVEPTLCVGGDDGSCTELFGGDDARLADLRALVEAVIDGRFEWRRRQVRRGFLFFRLPATTQFVGTFHTPDGPWVFTREGAAESRRGVEHRTYQPYVASA